MPLQSVATRRGLSKGAVNAMGSARAAQLKATKTAVIRPVHAQFYIFYQ